MVATILFAWEHGGGMGHLMQMRPLVKALAGAGHRVFAALKDLSRARFVLERDAILLQAPTKLSPPQQRIHTPLTFAHILHNLGYESMAELSGLAGAWRTLYRLIRPDVIFFDHSPTAMLAARGLPSKRIVLGSGFCIPPDQSPLPNLRPWQKVEPLQLFDHEQRILKGMNRVLAEFGAKPMERITQIYSEVDETLLLTYEELDHYPGRKNATYHGMFASKSGQAPVWPEGEGPRIYAYLKAFPALPQLLETLVKLRHPSIVVSDGIPAAHRRRFASATLRFETRRLDMSAVGRECDAAILNAGHGTTADMLLAGKPMLLLPIYLEQAMLARAVVKRLGAGLAASIKNGAQIVERLGKLFGSDEYAQAARRFGGGYASDDPVPRIMSRLSALGLGREGVRPGAAVA